MFSLQARLDERLAELKTKPGAQRAPAATSAQIKATLKKAGIISSPKKKEKTLKSA